MIIDEEDYDTEYIAHYGVLGMHWGVRNDRPAGVSGKVNRMAKKDAHEYARAKLFYGEGAGTRRKLIGNTVAERTKRVSGYGAAFDHHYAKQDLSKHASAAVGERGRKDKRKTTKQGFGYVARRITGEQGFVAGTLAVGALGVAFASSPRGRQAMSTGFGHIKGFSETAQRHANARNISRIMNL